MAQSDSAAHDGVSASGQEVLRAQLSVTPHPAASCAVVDEGHDATELRQTLRCTQPDAAGSTCAGNRECHVALVDDSDQTHRYLTSAVEPNCLCPVFEEYDCIPTIEAVENGSIVVVVSVPDRGELRGLVDGLRRVDATVSVEWLVSGATGAETTEIDVSSITSKQQETLETAMEMGYYERPRTTTLSDLADALGISESAASQRLNTAETKLVRSYLDD